MEKTNAVKKLLTGGEIQRGPAREMSEVFSLPPCKVVLCAEQNGLITPSNSLCLVAGLFGRRTHEGRAVRLDFLSCSTNGPH